MKGSQDVTDGALDYRAAQVCLVTEGTYPHYTGGVSTWCDMLVHGLPSVDFTLVSLVADPSARPVFKLPANLRRLVTIPLWGTAEVLELRRSLSLWAVLRHKRSASPRAIINEFLPWFRAFLRQLWNVRARPESIGVALQHMAEYFIDHDYDVTMRAQPVWECFLAECQRGYAELEATHDQEDASLLDVTDAMRLLFRWLTVLTVSVPQADVIHAASGGLCSILGILGKRHGASFLLTEHGLYLRERLLALSRVDESRFTQVFQARFAQRITEAAYFYADRIAPGSDYNHRWERHCGARPERIGTIYNGPDPSGFTPVWDHRPTGAPPTIVWLGRIDPLKDLETLIRAAGLVHQVLPRVRFVLYGKPPKMNEWYEERCMKLRDELGLKETVVFAGYATSAEAAYNEGDFAILSSISEGFPYSVVEAMLCGRTVVGTDVGGVSEALEGCGLVVEPRNPKQMAEACLRLLQDPALCRDYGLHARTKALERFTMQHCNTAYLAAYQRMVTQSRDQRLTMLSSQPAMRQSSWLGTRRVRTAATRPGDVR